LCANKRTEINEIVNSSASVPCPKRSSDFKLHYPKILSLAKPLISNCIRTIDNEGEGLEKEEQLLIPVLEALQPYVNGTLTDEARNQVIKISQQFKKEYPTMVDEHKKIVTALDKLEYNAMRENRKDALSFIAEFKSDAINEEQVTYPATIVVGELLELKK
jgi:hypothetical protein